MIELEKRINVANIGLDLVVVGSCISCIGVIANNILLNHILAMQIWVISNFIFIVYFYGRGSNWWDGVLSDRVMCLMYVVMFVSGIWGLMQ